MSSRPTGRAPRSQPGDRLLIEIVQRSSTAAGPAPADAGFRPTLVHSAVHRTTPNHGRAQLLPSPSRFGLDRRDADRRRRARRRRNIRPYPRDRARLSAGAHANSSSTGIAEIETAPGIVLYTLVEPNLSRAARDGLPRRSACPASRCSSRSCSCFQAYLGVAGPAGPARSTCSTPNISGASTR